MNNINNKDYTATKVLTTAGGAVGAYTVYSNSGIHGGRRLLDFDKFIPDEFSYKTVLKEQKEAVNDGLRDFIPKNIEILKIKNKQFEAYLKKAFKAEIFNSIRNDLSLMAIPVLGAMSLGLLIDGIRNRNK